MKTKQILFIAAAAMATCGLFSCGDDKEEVNNNPFANALETKKDTTTSTVDGHKATKLNLNGISAIKGIEDSSSVFSSYVLVSQEISTDLHKKGVDGILLYVQSTLNNKTDEYGINPEFKVNEYSKKIGFVYLYPVNVELEKEIHVYIDDVKGYLDGLNYSFVKNDVVYDNNIENGHIHFATTKFGNIEIRLNAKIEVVSEERVKIETKPEKVDGKNILASKYGVEGCDNNPIVYSVINDIIGTNGSDKPLMNSVAVTEDKDSYTQKVIKIRFSSGEKTFDVTVYGKAY